MYSVLFSEIKGAIDLISEELKQKIKRDSKLVILPWAFPIELTSEEFENSYFPIRGRRYNKYMESLKKIGIEEEQVTIANPYKHTKKELQEMISRSDILLLPGGNPEMFFSKILHDTEIIYDIKNYKGIIISESAGTELQLERYLITSTNNYYQYTAFYDGFGVIKNDFYIDVHTLDTEEYQEELQNISNNVQKIIYAIYDNGVMIYDREENSSQIYGKVKIINPIDR